MRAARGQREVAGTIETIEDTELVVRLKAIAGKVNLRAVALTSALTAAVCVCPA